VAFQLLTQGIPSWLARRESDRRANQERLALVKGEEANHRPSNIDQAMTPRWLVLGTLVMSGCANSRASGPSDPGSEASLPPPDGDGPPLSTLLERRCSLAGPSVEVTSLWMIPGKPPHDTYFMNLRIRNPLPGPIWLLYDLHHSIPLWIRAVHLDERGETPRSLGWRFDGGNRFMDAVRVAAHADVVVRALNYSSYAKDEPLILVLAADVTIAGRPATAWMGRQDQPLARGEINMEWVEPSTEEDVKRENRWVPLRVQLICASQVDRATPWH
jgi:hypothetical protein